jgi:hypothetical protein
LTILLSPSRLTFCTSFPLLRFLSFLNILLLFFLVIAVLSWVYLLTVYITSISSSFLSVTSLFHFLCTHFLVSVLPYVSGSSCVSLHCMSLCHVSCSCFDILSTSLLHSQQKQRLMYRAKS